MTVGFRRTHIYLNGISFEYALFFMTQIAKCTIKNMAIVHARYLTGFSIQLTKCESIGQIMVHVANLHKRFAQDVAVTCPDTGRDLTDPPSQVPPSVVQVVIKRKEKKITDEHLLLAVRLHGQYEDAANCLRAYKMLKKRHSEDKIPELLAGVIGKPLSDVTDIKTQKAIVETLLRVGVNLNYFLYEAAEYEDESRVQMLLSAGVPVEGNVDEDESYEGFPCTLQTPLSIAAYSGFLGTVKILLAHKADPNRVSELHRRDYRELGTPLLLASSQNHADVVRELLTQKALVDLSFSSRSPNRTPLYIALQYGSEEVVEVLLANRANVVDGYHFSLFKEACNCNHNNSTKLLKMLIDHGGSFPKDRISDLLTMAWSADSLKILLDLHLGDILEQPLHQAAHTRRLEKVNALLDLKADINRATTSGTNLLHEASVKGDLDLVKLLLARRANVNKEDGINGKTALAYALDNNRGAVADLLQKHDAILPGESSNKVLAFKRKRESEDCSTASASKRQKSMEDETSGKKKSARLETMSLKKKRSKIIPARVKKIKTSKSPARGSAHALLQAKI